MPRVVVDNEILLRGITMRQIEQDIVYCFKPLLFERYKDTSFTDLVTTITMVDWKILWRYSSFGVFKMSFGPAQNFTDLFYKYKLEFYPLNDFAMLVYKVIDATNFEEVKWSLKLSEEQIFQKLIDIIAKGEHI